jgi:anti-sigma regulatory factor (Ser/Thr protein kinase)
MALENVRHIADRLEEEKRRKEFSRDVIMSVTGGKLVIAERPELASVWKDGRMEESLKIGCGKDVGSTRRIIEKVASEIGFSEECIFDLAICVTEVAGNVVKHAGSGEMHVQTKCGTMQIKIMDSGPGIKTTEIPQALLMKGFSTKPSLGMGYSIVMELMDVIYLASDSKGTVVILEKRLPSEEEEDPLEKFRAVY